MVYDYTRGQRPRLAVGADGFSARPGFALHGPIADKGCERFEIYEDDGAGNGDFICSVHNERWARTIAESLDQRTAPDDIWVHANARIRHAMAAFEGTGLSRAVDVAMG